MSKPVNPASALARLRWANTTPEQRKAATAAATKASPRTKVRVCPGCGGVIEDLRMKPEAQSDAHAAGRCFYHLANFYECNANPASQK